MDEGEGALEGYHDEVKNPLAPFLDNIYSDAEQLCSEMEQVATWYSCGM